MIRYSTSFEFSNLKNSLKSGGSWIIAIDYLTHQLKGFHTFSRRLGAPELSIIGFLVERSDLEGRAVQPYPVDSGHTTILLFCCGLP